MTCPICDEEWASYQETRQGFDAIRAMDHHYRICSEKVDGVWKVWKHTKRQVKTE